MSIRVYLVVVSVLLVLSLCAGVYVWFMYQQAVRTQDSGELLDASSEHVEEVGIQQFDTSSTSPNTPETTETAPTTPRVLTAESLTSEQRAVLEAFGMGEVRVVVDEALLTCVSEAIGNDRLAEITGGSAPSPFEALKIATCL